MPSISSDTITGLRPPGSQPAGNLPDGAPRARAVATSLPQLFPSLSPALRWVLFTDFGSPARVPTAEEWLADCDRIIDQRLAAVALRAIGTHGVEVPPAVRGRLEDARFAWSFVSHAAVNASHRAIALLSDCDIPYGVSKGPGIALAGVQTPDRPFSDLDVLVAPCDFPRALRLLGEAGFAEVVESHQPWGCFDRWCREAINLRDGSGGSIDLHHRVPPWFWTTRLRVPRLLAAARKVPMFGQELRCLAPEHNLLISALHVVSDRNHPGQTLMAWRDVLTMAAVAEPGIVRREAEVAGLVGWLQWILRSLPEEVQPRRLLGELARSPVAELPGQTRLRLMGPEAVGSRHIVGQAFRLPLFHGGVFLAGMAVPSPGFLRERFPEDRHRYLRWWRQGLWQADHPGRPAARR